jgi:hypothetical protein
MIRIEKYYTQKEIEDLINYYLSKITVGVSFKETYKFVSPLVGTNDQYADYVTIDIPDNAIITHIDVAFDGLANETGTVKLEIFFDDETSGIVEISASYTEGVFVKKSVSALELYQSAGGSFSGEPVTLTKRIVKINVYAKSSASMPSYIPYVIIRYYA